MKKCVQSISIFITAALLFAAVVGCDVMFPAPVVTEPPPDSPGLPPVEQEVETPTETDSNDIDYMEPFSRYNETVIVTVGRFHTEDSDILLVPGIGLGSNAYIDMLYNELNIRVEIIFNVPYEEYYETLARHRDAGTLPDTFWIPNTVEGLRFLNELIINNRLADLTDAFTYSVGGMSRDFLDGWEHEQLFQYNMVDGQILGTPVIAELFNTPLMWIRQDWLDELELGMPRNVEELEAVALAFLDAGMGGRNAAGIMFMPDDMFGQHYGILPIFAAFGAYPDNWVDVGGYAEWGGIQPEARDALALLKDWNEMGIIPDRLLTMSGNEVFSNFIEGQRSGIFFGPWDQPRANWHEHGAASQNLNEYMQWMPFLGPQNAGGQYAPMNELIIPGGQVVLASHRNPEAVIKAMNLIDEVFHWRNPEFGHLMVRYIDPLVYMSAERRPSNPLNSLIMPQERLEIALVMRDFLDTGIFEVPNSLINNFDNHWAAEVFTESDINTQWWSWDNETRVEVLSDEEGLGLQIWWDRFVGYWAYNVVGNMFVDGSLDGSYVEVMPAFVGETNAWAEYGERLMGLQTSTFLQIISGRLPLEAFDDFVDEWFDAGGDVATREVNELLRR